MEGFTDTATNVLVFFAELWKVARIAGTSEKVETKLGRNDH